MKRIWFAVFFLAFATAVCIFEQSYITDFYRETDALAAKAVAAAQSGNKAEYDKQSEKIEALWNKRNDVIFALSGHNVPNEMAFKIHALKGNPELIYEFRAVLKAYYEDSRISASNIL